MRMAPAVVATLALAPSLAVLAETKTDLKDTVRLGPQEEPLKPTFLTPSGRIEKIDTADDAPATVFFDRWVVRSTPPPYMFAAASSQEQVVFVCDDFQVDTERRILQCSKLQGVKCGNLVVQGRRAEIREHTLIVHGDADQPARLYHIPLNRYSGPVEELQAQTITVDLKAWSAKTDVGHSKTLPIPRQEKKAPGNGKVP